MSLVINGGTYKSTGTTAIKTSYANVDVNAGTIGATTGTVTGLYVSEGNIDVSGSSTYVAGSDKAINWYVNSSNSRNLKVNGGTVIGGKNGIYAFGTTGKGIITLGTPRTTPYKPDDSMFTVRGGKYGIELYDSSTGDIRFCDGTVIGINGTGYGAFNDYAKGRIYTLTNMFTEMTLSDGNECITAAYPASGYDKGNSSDPSANSMTYTYGQYFSNY